MKSLRLIKFLAIASLCSASACSPTIWGTPESNNRGTTSTSDLGLSTTGMGAATGAVLGGGLGLIVGSSTGNAGEGLVIGSIAGAATGGLIGNELENQEEWDLEQEEVMRRQQEMLDRQKRELDELKDMAGDPLPGTPVTKSSLDALKAPTPRIAERDVGLPPARARLDLPRDNVPALDVPTTKSIARDGREYIRQPSSRRVARNATEQLTQAAPKEETIKPKLVKNEYNRSSLDIVEPKAVVETPKPKIPVAKPKIETPKPKVVAKPIEKTEPLKVAALPPARKPIENASTVVSDAVSSAVAPVAPSRNCKLAEEEAVRARNATSTADKLFYFRRAIRLCPSVAVYHLEVGKIYLKIERHDDAEYEFRQALDLDPDNQEAEEQLTMLQADG